MKNPSDNKTLQEAPVPKVTVHDIKGVVVFPMTSEIQELLGAKHFSELCEDLGTRDIKLIYRTPERIVYVQLSPIVVPMDLVGGVVPPSAEALAAARRKHVLKTVRKPTRVLSSRGTAPKRSRR